MGGTVQLGYCDSDVTVCLLILGNVHCLIWGCGVTYQ